jgi:hypothetical protein
MRTCIFLGSIKYLTIIFFPNDYIKPIVLCILNCFSITPYISYSIYFSGLSFIFGLGRGVSSLEALTPTSFTQQLFANILKNIALFIHTHASNSLMLLSINKTINVRRQKVAFRCLFQRADFGCLISETYF